jgi:hypothetical protein
MLARSALPRERFRSLAHLRSRGRRPRRLLIGVLRAPCLPIIETVISSIRKRTAIAVPWRPVLKQVLPWRSLYSAAEIDPHGHGASKNGAAQQRNGTYGISDWLVPVQSGAPLGAETRQRDLPNGNNNRLVPGHLGEFPLSLTCSARRRSTPCLSCRAAMLP